MTRPLVHIIANDVTRAFVADGVHCYGGSPIMTENPKEFADIHTGAQALVISLGMIDDAKCDVLIKAVKSAEKAGIPIGIDPVGVHLSAYRKAALTHLLDAVTPAFIRGNYDEIRACYTDKIADRSSTLESQAQSLSSDVSLPAEVLHVVTGAVDRLYYKGQHLEITGGSEKLTRISGAGCLLSALIGVDLAKGYALYNAGSRACKAMKTASLKASASGLGHFKLNLLDALGNEVLHD